MNPALLGGSTTELGELGRMRGVERSFCWKTPSLGVSEVMTEEWEFLLGKVMGSCADVGEGVEVKIEQR